MTEEIRKAVALFRHQIISPVLVETKRERAKYFREQAGSELNVPGQGKKKISAWTMKGWLKAYKKNGFHGLMPKARSDPKYSC